MHKKPLLSVVLITYNQEKYAAMALKSILEQRVSFPVEILVSDDASTDTTADILRDIVDQHPGFVKLYVRKKMLGRLRMHMHC